MIAVAALYAFALQTVLAGPMPLPGPEGVVCAQHAQDDVPGKAVPHGHGDCCTAAQAPGSPLPPRGDAATIAWPAPRAVGVAWVATDAPRARAPPGRMQPPRGPPVT